MAPSIPTELRPYHRTPIFDEGSMPPAWRTMHETAGGVWGKICVIEGQLTLRFVADGSEQLLSPARFGMVCPRQAHELAPLGPVRFYIEFYAETPAGQKQQKPAGEPLAAVTKADLNKPMHPAVPGKVAPPGLDEAGIVRIVDAFYAKVRTDPVIGPVFDAHIAPERTIAGCLARPSHLIYQNMH